MHWEGIRMMYTENRIDYISYCASYVLAFTASRLGYVYLAGIVLMLEALLLYMMNLKRSGNLTDLRGLFSLSWVGGEGIACLQLSRLQSDWETLTWVCFFLAYFCFMSGYTLSDEVRPFRRNKSYGMPSGYTLSDGVRLFRRNKSYGMSSGYSLSDEVRLPRRGMNYGMPSEYDTEAGKSGKQAQERCRIEKNARQARRILICVILLGAGSIFCFLLEAVVLGFIPLFSPEPHAYSYFHISGVHYFTVSCILIPALSVLYVRLTEKWTAFRFAVLAAGNLTAVGIPILCVSRFQLLFAVGFAAVVYLMLYRHVTWKMIVTALIILIPVYVLLTVARRHDITYLNGIFEMKYDKMPIFITQPYIYVANNYENFNCMVAQLPKFSMGLRMLFPFFALTGLKFVFPQVTAFPLYTTKEELTTVTLFYDAYYDFGFVGIILLAFVLGCMAAWMSRWVENNRNPAAYLFYGQIAIYLGLSFFTTWFSNPTTWFWLAMTFGMYVFVGYHGKERSIK